MNKPVEELIQRLKEPDYKYYGCELSRGEAELAISALEKQIPKNIIIENGWKYCPACYECINDDYGTETNYCSDCGQRLDWSVEE